MRDSIFKALQRRMAEDKTLFFLTADVGINLVEKIAEAYPERFLNVGIAEQNLIGVAAGLANCGYLPVAYTISNFAVQRCLEQIRDDICVHQYPLILLGSTTGFDNASLGPTHHMVDEWGSLRALAGIEIHCPASVEYAKPLLDQLVDRRATAYVRIPKGSPALPASAGPVVHLPGASRSLVATYGVPAALWAQAQKDDPALSLLVFNRLRPVADESIAAILKDYQKLVVIEDHFAETGLFSTLCQVVARHGLRIKVESRAPTGYDLSVGASADSFLRKLDGDPRALRQHPSKS